MPPRNVSEPPSCDSCCTSSVPEESVVPPVWALCGLSRTVPPVAPVLTATVVAPLNTCVTFVDVPAGASTVTVAAMAGRAALAAIAAVQTANFPLFISSSLLVTFR